MPNKKYATDEERRQATLMYAKKYREKNPEKYKESQEKYKINNPFAKQNALKKYRENNKDKIKKRRKELYDINKDAINKKRRKLIDKRIKYTNEDQIEKLLTGKSICSWTFHSYQSTSGRIKTPCKTSSIH